MGTSLTDIGTYVAADPATTELGAVLVAAGLTGSYFGSDDQDTIAGVSVSGNWPGTSTATGIGVNQWSGGSVPQDVTSTPNSGNYVFSCTPRVCQKYANFLYGVDNWGTSGYVRYDEKLLGTPITGSTEVYLVWTATAQSPV